MAKNKKSRGGAAARNKQKLADLLWMNDVNKRIKYAGDMSYSMGFAHCAHPQSVCAAHSGALWSQALPEDGERVSGVRKGSLYVRAGSGRRISGLDHL